MMQFREDRPIYRQIVDYAYSCILNGEWEEGKRIPSVRELGVQMAVNTHTVLKAYEYLTDHGIIASQRGMGYFLSADARQRVNQDRKDVFFGIELVDIFKQMQLLDISIDQVVEKWQEFNKIP